MAESYQGETIQIWTRKSEDPSKMIDRYYQAGLRGQRNLRKQWIEIAQQYHGYIQQRRVGRSNYHIPKIFPQIEMECARWVAAYYRSRPMITVLPNNEQSVEAAKVHERVLEYYMMHCPVAYLEDLRLMKYTALFDTGFKIPSWKTIRRKRKIVRPASILRTPYGDIPTDWVDDEIDEIIYDGIWFKTYSPSEVLLPEFCGSIHNARWAIVEEYVHCEELVELADMGIYDKAKVMQIPLNGAGQEDAQFRLRQTALGRPALESDREMVRLVHLFLKDHWRTKANNAVMIRDRDNPHDHHEIPMIQGIKTLDPDSPWPIGSARMIVGTQKMTRAVVNMMIDHSMMSAYWMWKHTGDVNPSQLVSMPNGCISVKQMSDVDIVQPPEMKHDLLLVKEMLERSQEETTGYFSGQKGGGNTQTQTATSDAIFQQEGNLRIAFDTKTYEELTKKREAKLVSSNVLQYMPDDLEMRMAGPYVGMGFKRVTREESMGEFDFEVSGASESINRTVIQAQLTEFYKIVEKSQQLVRLPNGQMFPVPVLDVFNAAKDIYEGFGRRNVDKILLRPELFGLPVNNDGLTQYASGVQGGGGNFQTDPLTGATMNQFLAGQMNLGGDNAGAAGNMMRSTVDQISAASRPQIGAPNRMREMAVV